MQVTELKCGAIVVSCALDHRIADAFSLNMFLVAWAEFAQTKKLSNLPSFRTSLLNPRRPPRYDKTYDHLYLPKSSLPPPRSFDEKLHSRIYHIGFSSINHLQSQASSKTTRRSKLRSFTAFVWKLLAQEQHNDANKRTKRTRMGVIVNGRRFLTGNNEKESSILANHFGNIVSVPYGEFNNQDLQGVRMKFGLVV
ncbi:hypothetical protein SSX86_032806 [Deinandra increscens subsp. villosa]|uniref:Uncharacterized protein n=1 Tax=Deinandra increscens subsp. villosa TaxID=3103831 RepID=A0AAP0C3N4_9ASTR